MRNNEITKKVIALLLVLLMLGSLLGITVAAVESTTAEGTSGPDAAYGAINPDYRISDSPYLRLPDDMLNWTPIVPPEPREVEDMEDPSAVEVYNVATGGVILVPSNDTTQQPIESGLNSTLPYQGLLPPGIVPESVFPPDDRARKTNTGTYPWRTIVKLRIEHPSGQTGSCSGAIIGCPDGHGYHILTAGHCVYLHDEYGWAYDSWAKSIKVIPGIDEDYMPYNYAWATYFRSYTGWTVNRDHRHDWALLTLDRNVGDFTGWMGRITHGSGHNIYRTGVNTAGYPCNYASASCTHPKLPVNSMWWDFDNGRTATEHNHWYYMDTQPGQSGSPVWLYNYYGAGNRYITTVHAYGNDSSNSNHGTRLNQDKYDRIITWCNADTPPTDKADLIDDGQAYSGFSPTTVKPGSTSFHDWCNVRNIGTAASGGFHVSYYASTNTYISTSDYLIGTDYVSSISPFNWKDSDWTGTFPSGVPDGNYYVGWIIDSGDDVTEFDETNNVAYKDSYKLLVDGTKPSATISINSGATYTNTRSVTLSLNYSDSGSGVDKCRYKNSGGSWTSWQTCTPTKSWNLSTGDGTKRVYYEVKDNVGNVRQVSDTIILDTTDPSASISINSGATCTNTRSVTLSLTYSDSGSGVDKCRYKNSGGSWSSWQTCTPTKAWTLTSGDGTKTVYYQVRDRAGNIRQVYDSIRLDTTPPPAPVISSSTHPDETKWYCNKNPTFTWTTPSDASGIACYSYTLDHSPTTTPDKICDTTGNSKSYSGLAYGTWYFHVRAKDNAGNWGSADHYRVMIENCDDKDGCYTYGNGCEDRDYYCDGSVCKYTVSNRHTDYYGGWVYYCKGDEIWKQRPFHDFYCEGGTCTNHTSWNDDQLVEDCNDHDGWYDTGDTRWIDDPANECKEKEQKEQEYRDYTCSGGACTYSVTNTQWIDTGNVRNKPDGTVCGCTANNTLKECYGGTCTDTGICNSTYCAADAACDGKNPGDDCNGDRKCNATCKCVLTENSDLEITGTWICWPDNCTICYNVTNTGNGTASAGHNTMLYVDGLEVEYDPVPVALASGDGYIGCFNYVWAYTPPEDNITVCADCNDTVTESNETNNCLNETWKCGDVDMDGNVDFLGDVRGVARHYMYADSIKCPWAGDVDCDGDIDFLGDARGISRHYMYGEALDCCCN